MNLLYNTCILTQLYVSMEKKTILTGRDAQCNLFLPIIYIITHLWTNRYPLPNLANILYLMPTAAIQKN